MEYVVNTDPKISNVSNNPTSVARHLAGTSGKITSEEECEVGAVLLTSHLKMSFEENSTKRGRREIFTRWRNNNLERLKRTR